jgi:putative FmdB family regulatory protein
MPIYEYRCDRGHTFEVTQRMTDDPVTSCSSCEAPVQRVFHPVAVHFKGSGFYTTDYGKRKTAGDTAGGSDAKDANESKKDSAESKGSKDSKKDAKASTKSD